MKRRRKSDADGGGRDPGMEALQLVKELGEMVWQNDFKLLVQDAILKQHTRAMNGWGDKLDQVTSIVELLVESSPPKVRNACVDLLRLLRDLDTGPSES